MSQRRSIATVIQVWVVVLYASGGYVQGETVVLSCEPTDETFATTVRVEISLNTIDCGDGTTATHGLGSIFLDWNAVPGALNYIVNGCCPPFGTDSGGATTLQFGSSTGFVGLACGGSVQPQLYENLANLISDSLNAVTVRAIGSAGTIATSAPCDSDAFELCGNAIIEGNEQCDDGNTSAHDCCSPTCALPVDGGLPIPEAELLTSFPPNAVGANGKPTFRCDATVLLPGTYPVGGITDGAGNRFDYVCEVQQNSVGLLVRYTSGAGGLSNPCSKLVGVCEWPGGWNDWHLRRSSDPDANCFTGSYWKSVNPATGQWKRRDFDSLNCELDQSQGQAPTPPPGAGPASTWLTTRDFSSADGPGGASGDLLIDIQFDSEAQPVDLPLGVLTTGFPDPCDNDGDGDCELDDFSAVGSAVGGCEGDADYNEVADVDFGGCVTRTDLEMLISDCTLILTDRTMTQFQMISHDDLIAELTTTFDMVTGVLSDLRQDGNFSGASCLATSTATAVDNLPDPSPGEGRYFLAQGLDGCATYGDSSMIPDLRDDLDAVDPCP